MPVVDQIDCPYCDTKRSGFEVRGAFRRENTTSPAGGGGLQYIHEDWLLMSCGACKKTVSGVYSYRKRGATFDLGKWMQSHGDPKSMGFEYVEHHPSSGTKEVPEHVPEKVAIPYKQALSNMASSNFDAAGTMARKTLELTTKDIVRNSVSDQKDVEKLIRKTWLKGRISELNNRGLITDSLADLATLIKDEGDEATHDEEPYDEASARLLIMYAEALLTYIYTVPGMVADVQGVNENDGDTSGTADSAK